MKMSDKPSLSRSPYCKIHGFCMKKHTLMGSKMRLLGVSHYFQKAGKHPSPRRIAPGHQCVEWVTGGRGWVEIDGRWQEVVSGDLLWHQSGDMTIARSDWENPYRCLAVIFRGGRHALTPRWTGGLDASVARNLAEEAPGLFLDPNFDREILFSYLISTFVFQVRRQERRQGHPQLPVPIRRVVAAVEENSTRRWTVTDLAQLAGWSPPHLTERFREFLGQTPHKWLLLRRLRKSQEELMGTQRSIKEIADACGFYDTAAFVHAFKRNIGRTPGAYRTSQKKLGSSVGPLNRSMSPAPGDQKRSTHLSRIMQ
jgi:AraC-like DNA-binding protein